MVKKKFIDKKKAQTFSLVFRPNGLDDDGEGGSDGEGAPRGMPLDDFDGMDPGLAEMLGMARCGDGGWFNGV